MPHASEIGLLTLPEYLDRLNPDGKFHYTDSWDWPLEKMNETLRYMGSEQSYHDGRWVWFSLYAPDRDSTDLVIKREDKPVAVILDGTLWVKDKAIVRELPRSDARTFANVPRGLPVKVTKYLSPLVARIEDVKGRNLATYPVILRHLRAGGQPFQIRTAQAPEQDAGQQLVILNEKGEVVATAQDEWGATLLIVAQEYRGLGLGRVLGALWYELNPKYTSGGFTEAGRSNASARWEDRIRELLATGVYSDLVRRGELTRQRLRDILRDLPKARRPGSKALPPAERSVSGDDLLFFVEYPGFVIYDKRFFEDPDEKYIYGHGHLVDGKKGDVLYRLDYEPQFRRLATVAALQLARDEGQPVQVDAENGDTLELDGIDGIQVAGGVATLVKDELPLRELGLWERRYRRQHDTYNEKYHLMLEGAYAKTWDRDES